MSRYSHVNLLEVEDSVSERAPGLQGRFGRKHLDSRDLGVSHWRYDPNFRAPFAHSHKEQEEVYVVVRGSGRVKVEDEIVELGQWDAIRFDTGTMRNMEAGPEGMDLIAVGGPKPEGGDGVPGEAAWPERA